MISSYLIKLLHQGVILLILHGDTKGSAHYYTLGTLSGASRPNVKKRYLYRASMQIWFGSGQFPQVPY